VTGEVKLIDVPLTSPTANLPLLLSDAALKLITTLLAVVSKVVAKLTADVEENSAAVPKEIDVPLTVPTTALPLSESPPSL